MNIGLIRLLLSFIIAVSFLSAHAQDVEVIQDTSTIAADTIPNKSRNTFLKIFRGKPGRAALYSLVVPSGGQIYNKKWWKVPLALGIDGFLAYNLYQNTSRFNKYNTIFEKLVNGGTDPDFSNYNDVKPIRDDARIGKENAVVYLIIGHLVTVFDAFIDRHLLEFDTSDDISIMVFPPLNEYEVLSYGFAYKF